MMNETQKRISEYKKALPGLKEKVVAVALLLALSVAMLATASFAWLALSRSPEVSGVSTSIAANGNLEIALVGANGDRPDESKVGDSSAAAGQSVTAANITWGNLVNLSDPKYGLDKLVLRPAQLNRASLLTSPIYGAEYSEDGRVLRLLSNFAYATWQEATDEVPAHFAVSDDLGVRAITSVMTADLGAENTYRNMLNDAIGYNNNAIEIYEDLKNSENSAYMGSVATMMGHYMTCRFDNTANPTVVQSDIKNLVALYEIFLEAFEAEADALASLVNLQLFLAFGRDKYNEWDRYAIYTATPEKLADAVANAPERVDDPITTLVISKIETFTKDYETISTDIEKLKALEDTGDRLWKDCGMSDIINNLTTINTCKVGGYEVKDIGMSEALGMIFGTQQAIITNGVIYNFEERTGAVLELKNVAITATAMGQTATIRANITTNAPHESNLFNADKIATEEMNNGEYQGGDEIAKETYALAIDLWVRTNAANSYLTLEGNIKTETIEVQAQVRDANGTLVDVWTITVPVEEGSEETETIDLYQSGDKWIRTSTHQEYTNIPEGQSPSKKMIQKEITVGYEGENRVWGDDASLTVNSTTQGSGSCYVYYADSPTDQARSLELLKSMRIAYIDDKGKLLATAEMDTEHYYADNGKVIVPMVIVSGPIIGTDADGNSIYAITDLEQNVPTRITAIVYLDGTKLANDDVLSAADIQGQLNIQFGSTSLLSASENEALSVQERTVSASVDVTSFKYDEASESNPMTTNVTVTVDGDQPKEVKAFFIRSINSTQGSREKVMTFEKLSDGSWTASYTFTSPGNYILRSVQLDGVEYDLATRPMVTIDGFTIDSLDWEASTNDILLMTAANSTSVDLNLNFKSNDEDKMPKTVQGHFIREDGTTVVVNFTYNPSTQKWIGTAKFGSSGFYSLQYLLLDGEYQEIDSEMQKFVTVYLGMKVEVITGSPTTFKYIPDEMTPQQKNLAMQVTIMDNMGNKMPSLAGVELFYSMVGSNTIKMHTDLIWNDKEQCYTGTFETSRPGVFEFESVTITNNGKVNKITNDTESPVFTIQSPKPPEYMSHVMNDYQFIAGTTNKATATVTIDQSVSATAAYAVFTDGDKEFTTNGKRDNIAGSETNAAMWTFNIPTNSTDTQDGNWKLLRVKLVGVYDASGTCYGDTNPMIFDFSDKENTETKVVETININFAGDQTQKLGEDASGKVIGAFMDTFDVTGLNVDIKDFEDQQIPYLKDVKLTFTFKNDSEKYGGYMSDSLNNTTVGAVVTVDLNDDGTGMHFAQDKKATFKFAGSYETKLSFRQDTDSFTRTEEQLENEPKVTVSTITPTVEISKISPTGTLTVDMNDDCKASETNCYGEVTSETNNHTIDGATASCTKTVAYVYFKCEKGTTIKSNHNYTQPTVTITLNNMGNASSAALSFGDDAHVYSSRGGTTKTDYSWSSNGDCERYIGYYVESGAGTDTKIHAGTITANKLVVTYDSDEDNKVESYIFTIPTITIYNQY